MSSQVDELTQAVRDVALQINAAQERAEDREVVTAAHLAADALSARFKAFYETLSDGEKMKIDRTLGRRVQDIRRSASLLPRIGNIAGSTPDRHPTNASGVSERRITGVSWGSENSLQKGRGLRVGGEVEAWCGPCAGLTDHTIVAMVGELPKQVICQACNNRHGYRTTPARKAEPVASDEPQEQVSEYVSPPKATQKTVEQNALANLVNAAIESGTIRQFDPKERYKTGEIISHPLWGRGRIETVLRASLLVKFVNGGLKAVSLQ
ncbi:MAG: hypothetical protein SF187_22210 [Deltaproteobacteria bacterium]|nr:hypothetical protein [Deltaproteobacteria bacterium]